MALESLGAEVFETPLQRNGTGIWTDISYLSMLTRLFKRLRPDLLLTYTIKPNIWGGFAASRAGVPSVSMVTGLGYAFSGAGGGWALKISRWLARRLYRASTRRNIRVIFQNPDDRDDFCGQGCLADKTKIRMVNGSGVDLQRFRNAPVTEAPAFVMIARLLVSKGVREYIEAARLVKQRHPEAQFILVGPQDHGPDSINHELYSCLVNEGIVSWTGPTEDVRPAIRDAAVVVLPSYREGTPRSVLEAMAMGRPIVTTDAPGCRETVVNGENGFLVPVRNSEALAKAMSRFIEEPTLIAAMGERSYEIVRKKYAVEKVNSEVLKILGIQ